MPLSMEMKKKDNWSHFQQGFVFPGILFYSTSPAYKLRISLFFKLTSEKISLKQNPTYAAVNIS